jgi:TonB-dependent receptor
MKLSFLIALLFSVSTVFSQNSVVAEERDSPVISKIADDRSIIKGTVIEESTGKALPGVQVLVVGTRLSTVTDSEGKFSFRKMLSRKYDLQFSLLSFETKIISEVEVIDKEATILTVSLSEKNNVLDEVVIKKVKAKAESVQSLLTMQKNSIRVSDGISAESIKRTPDKTASDVLKRISGASIQNNKFVIIRGLNDRYNTTYLNGAPMPSTEPDRKAFSFDIFPANMIDNLVIYKTASPDLPGEFAGGVIEINTKATPDKNFQSISIGTGYNTITTGKKQMYSKDIKSKLDASIPNVDEFKALQNARTEASVLQIANFAKNNQTDWNLYNKKFNPNSSFQYTLGRYFKFRGEESVGILVSLSNSTSNNYNETKRKNFDDANVYTYNLLDKNYSVQTLSGALVNLSLRLNANNKFSFKNLYSINTDARVTERTGPLTQDSDPLYTDYTNRRFTKNKLYSGQLSGEHYLSQSKIKISWVGSFSNVQSQIPNERTNSYSYTKFDDGTEETPKTNFSLNSVGREQPGSIYSSDNNEYLFSSKIDLSKKVKITENHTAEFKLGGITQTRDRVFEARQMGYVVFNGTVGGVKYNKSTFDNSILSQTNATIYNASNIGILGPKSSGLTLYDGSLGNDRYKADSKLNAGYLMIDNAYKKFRFVWGVRLEDYLQRLYSKSDSGTPITVDNSQLDFLPSANLIFSVNKKQNIRLSFSKTLNRPEFRELAPFIFYDNDTRVNTSGQPDLKIAEILNYDLRYEIFPGNGQLFSFSAFYKDFKNPIELRGLGNNSNQYQNAKSGQNKGVELEYRTLVSSIFGTENYKILDDLTFYSNLAIIRSKVDISNQLPSSVDIPLQGQSPYVINAGLLYTNKEMGLSFSANLNKSGNRIIIHSNQEQGTKTPAIWEKTRTILDFQLAKYMLKNKIDLKLNVQNALAQNLDFYQNNEISTDKVKGFKSFINTVTTGDSQNLNGYNSKTDDLVWSTKYAPTISFTVTYNF